MHFPAAESGGPSDSKGKSGTSNPPSASAGADTEENSELLSVWQQRLQSITLVTSFLASMDGSLFSLTTLPTSISLPASKTTRELVYSCLAGALIFHVSAAILGYVATFALIRYRIVDVSREEDIKPEGGLGSPSGLSTTPPTQRVPRKIVLEPIHPAHYVATFLQRPGSGDSNSGSSRSLLPPPPLSLLTRCYYTTLCLASFGFILALTGILTYAWAGLQMTVGIFSTACLGIAVGAGIWAVFI
ncbi:hypothetical protein PAXRUDRAFT_135162 [Paxillus rubicundulus Ve08.2h10]|uniref:Unplaced genomic scaffold scaffold_90, whole genome shotgun sequence n=1 Tax=Paxillus rubicundulus Ve08.2h10 TaxID=930991 RepID=A0A0D0DUI1_9AGAM|nr:hypothetical protein PAXRUDRAFT_135162 [Paxillus rubicundulus Ve08.2h10]